MKTSDVPEFRTQALTMRAHVLLCAGDKLIFDPPAAAKTGENPDFRFCREFTNTDCIFLSIVQSDDEFYPEIGPMLKAQFGDPLLPTIKEFPQCYFVVAQPRSP